MIRILFLFSLAIALIANLAEGKDRDHPFWKFKAQEENRWLLEKVLSKKYWNDNHKKAVKAAKDENWGMSLLEYEAAVRSIGFGFRKNDDSTDTQDISQAQQVVLEHPSLNSLRFELAIAYANRADELHSFGRSSEGDSLAELAVFFLEHVEVYAFGPWNAGVSFARLAPAFSRLGMHERAILYYRNALLNIESIAEQSDPLQAVVNIRLGQEYLLINKNYEAEPPLLRGAEFADSAAAAHKESRQWCRQLGVEGRAFLGEACRRMDRFAEAESLYAVAIQMAVISDPPMIMPHCRPLFDNYATLLRAKGDHEGADSVNYRNDLIQRRAEAEVDRRVRESKR